MAKGLDVFKMSEAMGLPIDMMLDQFSENNIVVDWAEYVDVAHQHGWRDDTILRKLEEAIIDVYGKQYWLVFETKIKMYMDRCL